MTTENQREAERLAPIVFSEMQKALIDGASYKTVDKVGSKLITAALDAAEHRGREKALEDAATFIEHHQDPRTIVVTPRRESGEYVTATLTYAEVFRAMKGEKK